MIALGSIPGALLRVQLDNYLVANSIGALTLGLISGISLNHRYQLLICIGFCGSLTTFATWMIDIANLILKGLIFESFFVIFSNLLLGFLFIFMGFLISKIIKLIVPSQFHS